MPDYSEFQREISCPAQVEVTLIDSNTALDRALSRRTSINTIGTNCRGFRFKECYSLSIGFSSFSRAFREKLQDKERVFIQAEARCQLYWGQIDTFDPPIFKPAFLKAVANLP